MSSPLGLPPVSTELKPILPFLQRAEEVKKQDPIVSYWCAYYAAQVGIGLKARDNKSKEVLFGLLNILESMKKSIGPSDAMDIEAVSAAYVENFALRVFNLADNEDRSSRATKSTAKKFLAAANFLEVLKTFPKTEVSETNEEKIRYAKWKASDIAKAFREGRKPVPGPPGWAEEQEELARLRAEQEEQNRIASALAGESRDISTIPENEFLSHSSTAPIIIPRGVEPISSSPVRPHQAWAHSGDAPSDTWSTAATPGLSEPPVSAFTTGSSASPPNSAMDWQGPTGFANGDATGRGKPRTGSDSSTGTARGILKPPSPPHSAGHTRSGSGGSSKSQGRSKSRSPDGEKRVHFSPSTADLSPSKSSPPKEYTGPASIYSDLPPAATAALGTSPPSLPPPPPPPAPASYHPPPPPHSIPSPSSPASWNPPPPSTSPPRAQAYQIYAPPAPPPPEELTPGLIAKVQKHCRYAVSALDYEDAETARKELRTALALLGG